MTQTRHSLITTAIAAAEAAEPAISALEQTVSRRIGERIQSDLLKSEPQELCNSLNTVLQYTSNAVREVRNNRNIPMEKQHINKATEYLRLADAMLATTIASQIVYAVGRYSLFNATAYLYYAGGKFAAAIDALQTANSASLDLLSLGFPAMHSNRIQLLHNVARVEIRCGREKTAFQLTEQLLMHLFGGNIHNVPLPGPWDGFLADACPIEIIAGLAYQIAGERAYWRYRLLT